MRRRIRDIRRDELIAATITAIHRYGFAAVTVSQIAETADASVGSISYYFGGKDRLLEGAMRSLLSVLRECTIEGQRAATTPRARLEAVALANFDPRLFNKAQCSVWMQFWAFAPYTPHLARLHRINRARVSSNIRAELEALVRPQDIDNAQRSLQAYMDGVWLEASQGETPAEATHAQTAARAFLATLLADDIGRSSSTST